MNGNQKIGNVALGIIHPAKAIEVRAQQKAAQQQLEEARKLRQQSLDLTGKLNWQPKYVSDALRPYQRAQSPVARSFLESLLTGGNPSAVQSTRLGAGRQQAAAQHNFDQQFGGWDALEAQQRQLAQEAPWTVTPPQTPVQKLPDNYAPSAGPSKREQAMNWTASVGLTDKAKQEFARRRAAGLL